MCSFIQWYITEEDKFLGFESLRYKGLRVLNDESATGLERCSSKGKSEVISSHCQHIASLQQVFL